MFDCLLLFPFFDLSIPGLWFPAILAGMTVLGNWVFSLGSSSWLGMPGFWLQG